MSTSETISTGIAPCPCGAGRIVRHVTTQDNPWSTADTEHTIECAACAAEWLVTDTALRHRGDSAAADAAFQSLRQAKEPLEKLAADLASSYFDEFKAPSKKAELAEMQRLGIDDSDYRSYLEKRKTNGPGASCRPLRNREWLRGLADAVGQRERLDELLAGSDAADTVWRGALGNVRRYEYSQ